MCRDWGGGGEREVYSLNRGGSEATGKGSGEKREVEVVDRD